MKVFLILSLSILFLQCKKEEKLSDGITFQYDKSLPMKYQEFDEGYGNMGGRILYYGHKPSKIPIKYYFSGIRHHRHLHMQNKTISQPAKAFKEIL